MLLYFIKNKVYIFHISMLLLLSHFSRVRLWVTPLTAAHQVPPSLGFSRQEHWIGLPFPSPMQESENCKWSRSVVSNSLWPHGLQPTKLLRPWDFPGKSMEWVAIAFSIHISIVSSVPQLCPTLCDPTNHSTPGRPVHHQLPEFTQTHVHRVSDAIQLSQPLLSPSPPAPNPSQHQSLFQWVNSSHEVAKVLEFQL